MTIDESGAAWKGSHGYDLYEYLEHVAVWDTLIQPACRCGCREFFLFTDHVKACAKAICTDCRAERILRDSPEQWERATLAEVQCGCGKSSFHLALGIRSRSDTEAGWTVLGFRCVRCGALGYSPKRCECETVQSGRPGPISGFVDLSSDPRILKAYPLHLYEVIYWGGDYDEDGGDGKDAMYLVAAKDYLDAAEVVDRNLTHCPDKREQPNSDMVQEIANNLTHPATTKILRGPYYGCAHIWGPRAWARNGPSGEWSECSVTGGGV